MPHNSVTDVLAPAVLAELHVPAPGQAQTLYQELAALYLNALPARLDALHAALALGDQEARNRLLHLFKGSSGTLGAHRLMELAAQWSLVDTAREEDLKAQFLEEVRRVQAALEAINEQNNQ